MSIQNYLKRFRHLWEGELHIQLRRFRWMAFPGVFLLATIHSLLVRNIARPVSGIWQPWIEILVYSITGSLTAWMGLSWIANAAAQRAKTEHQLQDAFEELEQRHQQLLRLNHIGEQIAAADSQHTILELATRAPLQLTKAQASTVVSFDQHKRLNLDMAWGLSDNYLGALRQRMDVGIDSERCRNCNTLHAHIKQDCPLFEGLQPLAEQDGITSLVCLPITLEKKRSSIITAYYPETNTPTDEHIRLLNIFSAVISGALEGQQSRNQQDGSQDAVIPTTHNPAAIAELSSQVLNIAISGWDAQAGGVFIYEEDTQTWVCHAQLNLGNTIADERFALGAHMAQRAFDATTPIIQADINGNSTFRSAAAAPLIAEGKILGALFLGSTQPKTLNQHHTELLATIAHQIALAIRNTQLYDQLGQMAALKERHRLSREFHDGLAQTLGFLNLQAEQIEQMIVANQNASAKDEIQELRKNIHAAYADVREAIDGLQIRLDEPGQLAVRLKGYTDEFTRQTGITTEFTTNPEDLTTKPEYAIQLLRIAQESLTNIRKHAHANRATVSLGAVESHILLVITDDGMGFPTTGPGERLYRSYGLTMMRERAEGIGGSFSVATSPGQGTRITVSVPIEIL